MLKKIISLFKEKKLLNLNELSVYLNTDESAIEGMLQLLVKKGYIQRLHLECNGCSLDCKTCSFASQKDYYEYIKNKGS